MHAVCVQTDWRPWPLTQGMERVPLHAFSSSSASEYFFGHVPILYGLSRSSSPSLLPPDIDTENLSGQALLQSRSAASLRLHHTRLAGLSERLALCFLLSLALFLAWLIGHCNASPALLVLLGVAALALGRGRWQGVVEGAGLEAELKVRKQLRTQLRGETAEWLNFLINRW